MGKTNWMRVLLGGLVAGIVINVLSVISVELFFKKMVERESAVPNPALRETPELIIFFIVFYLIIGILAVWLYSAIRPRYGAGIKSALLAGIAFWVLNQLMPVLGYGYIGLLSSPKNVLVIQSIRYLVMLVAGTLAGAWVYKEQSQ
jgi:hypothetical protein